MTIPITNFILKTQVIQLCPVGEEKKKTPTRNSLMAKWEENKNTCNSIIAQWEQNKRTRNSFTFKWK